MPWRVVGTFKRPRISNRVEPIVTCKKQRFKDEIAAKLALAKIGNKNRPGSRAESRAYHCPKCKGWHLTSQSKRGPTAPVAPIVAPIDQEQKCLVRRDTPSD